MPKSGGSPTEAGALVDSELRYPQIYMETSHTEETASPGIN